MLFAAGAIFNAVYTRTHTAEFYGSFVDGAWLPPAKTFVREVGLPNAVAFTVLLVIFQLAVAIGILGRGDLVRPALFAGAGFALLAALASNPGGTVGNLILAAMQVALALAR